MIVTGCEIMRLENGLPSPAVLCGGLSTPEKSERVEEQMLKFLDGETRGEELFHALYDHILDEPIPERMLALLKTGSAD